MNDEMEAEINKMDVTPGNRADSEDNCVDKPIPIQIRKERTTKAYKETMNKDIETIEKYENRRIVHIPQWRPIYQVIYKAYIKDSNIFPDDFIRECNKTQTNYNLYQLM